MIFTFFIAAVFASQSFRGIVNDADDTVTGKYKNEKMITIKHTRDTTTKASAEMLGYGIVNDDKTATFTKNETNLEYDDTANSVEVDFGYLEFLKSEGENKLIVKKSASEVITGDFTPDIEANSVTLGAFNGNTGYIEIREDTAHTNGKLFYYEDDTNSAELTYNDKKFSGKIDMSKIDLTGSSVNLGYVSAKKGTDFASSGIISAETVVTNAPTYSINDNGKVEFTTTPVDTTYQEFDGDLNKKEQVVVTSGNAKKEVDTTGEYHFWYAKIKAGTISNIEKVDLGKAPNVDLKFVGQEDESKPPKLQIVRGDGFKETVLVLAVPGRDEETITLNDEGKSPEYDWTTFKKVGDKKGSIYLGTTLRPVSVTKVIPDASITFAIASQDAEKTKVKFTMESGLIKDAPTHRCIFNKADDGMVADSAKCESLKWVKENPSEQSFEYKYTDLSKEGKSFVVITSSGEVTKITENSLSEQFGIPQTGPSGAFSAVATIFAALVSLFVFAF